MKRANIGAAVLFILLAACRPNVGLPISLIDGPAILAVKGEPAGGRPQGRRYHSPLPSVGGR